MSNHTLGPWIAKDSEIRSVEGYLVAAAEQCDVPTEMVEANAKLIAAAPDLLAACEALDDFLTDEDCDRDKEQWAAITALGHAIAKARGTAVPS